MTQVKVAKYLIPIPVQIIPQAGADSAYFAVVL